MLKRFLSLAKKLILYHIKHNKKRNEHKRAFLFFVSCYKILG